MAAQVNGNINGHNSSAFLEHLLTYPVISDSVTTFKQNQFGQKSMQLSDSAYKTFAQPVLPFFTKPYQYISPYVKKADDLGDQTLCRVDERFPAVKKPTNELYADAKTLVLFPYQKGMEGRDHVLNTYNTEYKKIGGGSLVTYSKAMVSTVLIVTAETLTWFGDYLNARKAGVKETVNDKVNN